MFVVLVLVMIVSGVVALAIVSTIAAVGGAAIWTASPDARSQTAIAVLTIYAQMIEAVARALARRPTDVRNERHDKQ